MIAAIYLDLTEKDFYPYNKEFIVKLKERHPSLITLDLDKNSEPTILEYALQLIKDSHRTIVFIECTEQISPKFLVFPELILKNPEKYLVFVKGENVHIKRILSSIDPEKVATDGSMEEMLTNASSFLESSSNT